MLVLTLRQVLVQSYVTGGTDGGALDLEWDDLDPLVHPRHLGTVPRWLGTYVREEKLMTWEDPFHYSVGMHHVFVNGEAVVKDSQYTAALPGRALRGPGYKNQSRRSKRSLKK